MKSLKSKLFRSFFQNVGGMVHPSTKLELIREIGIRLDRGQYDMNDIDTSKITDMSYLFTGYKNIPDIDISKWDVSNVKYMTAMFYGCTNFNSDLSKWDVSNVEYMNSMFYYCKNFNSDLSKWDVSNATKMKEMFKKSGVTPLPEWYKEQ